VGINNGRLAPVFVRVFFCTLLTFVTEFDLGYAAAIVAGYLDWLYFVIELYHSMDITIIAACGCCITVVSCVVGVGDLCSLSSWTWSWLKLQLLQSVCLSVCLSVSEFTSMLERRRVETDATSECHKR
jgi:hypothetical protein